MVAAEDTFVRGDFAETMKFSRVPDRSSNSGVKRFMSHTPAWKPAAELPWAKANLKYGASTDFAPAAYGGHVYAQAPYVAAKAVAEEDEAGNGAGKFGIHSIQGVFTKGGAIDRPFVYDVTQVHSGRTFATKFIQARQPIEASIQPSGPYPLTDADRPLGDVRFACLTTFKRPMASPAERQVKSAQERYADILSQRAPDEWEASPQMDVEAVTDLFPNAGHGGFPMLDMYKVDMTAYNVDKDTPERRELLLYRPHKPIAEDDADAHIVTHAFEADRNGLLMLTNHLGWGYSLGTVASLSYAFYVHVNAEEAVMKGDGWWIQEACWPRASAGRGLLESRIWSPEGKHVASGYQDGLALPSKKGLWWEKKKKAGEKL